MNDKDRGFQRIYSQDGESLIQEGWWDPKLILSTLEKATGHNETNFWEGKKVLDIGSNSCGLSIEIARKGASVVAIEPDPRAISRYKEALPFLKEENLQIELKEGTLEDALNSGESYDVVLFLGLLYHFKYPQFIVKSLSKIPHHWLFISTQCTSREGLVQVNRMEELPERMRISMTEMSGWHLSRELFVQILKDAGYSNIQEGSESSSNFTNTPRSITNSTYLSAKKTSTDKSFNNALDELYKFYPR